VAVKAKMRADVCLDDANDLAEEAGVAYHLVNLVQDDDPTRFSMNDDSSGTAIGCSISRTSPRTGCAGTVQFAHETRDASVTVMTGTDPDREVATMCCFRNGFVGLSRMALSTFRRAWPVGWAP
jgi:hypothetical protein